MKNPTALAAASACPVCGQQLSSADFACAQCGAIMALRAVRARGLSTADRVKARVLAVCHRGFSTLRSTVPKLVPGHRRWFYVVVAVLATTLIAAAGAEMFGRRDSAAHIAPSNNRELPAAERAPVLERRQTAGPLEANRTRAPLIASTGLGMIGATVLAALLCAVAVNSERRRRHDRSADTAGHVRARRMTQSASVAAAFCFGLAVALAVVLITESRLIRPLPAVAIGEGERVDQWRREASTLKERLSVLDARLASLESTRAGDGQVRQQPARTAAVDHLQRDASRTPPERPARPSDAVAGQESNDVSNASVLANYEASVKPPTADVLRSQRAPAAVPVTDRIWNDILRDWEHVRRTIRDLFSRDRR
jgi:predicted RNA-binding Zn-ribbon protein involved in translation (DUF1610 family)